MITITNFRDIGGIKTKEGKTILKNVFLRSGELTSVTQKDEQILKSEYHLTKIIDLRSESEIEERPDMLVPETEYIHIDILENVKDEGASMSDFIKIGSPEKSMQYMQKLYADIALDPIAQKGYQVFFDKILELKEEEGVLFHCFAGKDRTGIAALLILEALNASKEEIYADYLITNELRKEENALILAEAKETDLQKSNLEALHVALQVDSSYLDVFYKAVEDEYGDITNYLEDAIGLSEEKQNLLKNRFLVNE